MPPEVGAAASGPDRERAYSELFGWVAGLLGSEQVQAAGQEQQRQRVQKLVSAPPLLDCEKAAACSPAAPALAAPAAPLSCPCTILRVQNLAAVHRQVVGAAEDQPAHESTG